MLHENINDPWPMVADVTLTLPAHSALRTGTWYVVTYERPSVTRTPAPHIGANATAPHKQQARAVPVPKAVVPKGKPALDSLRSDAESVNGLVLRLLASGCVCVPLRTCAFGLLWPAQPGSTDSPAVAVKTSTNNLLPAAITESLAGRGFSVRAMSGGLAQAFDERAGAVQARASVLQYVAAGMLLQHGFLLCGSSFMRRLGDVPELTSAADAGYRHDDHVVFIDVVPDTKAPSEGIAVLRITSAVGRLSMEAAALGSTVTALQLPTCEPVVVHRQEQPAPAKSCIPVSAGDTAAVGAHGHSLGPSSTGHAQGTSGASGDKRKPKQVTFAAAVTQLGGSADVTATGANVLNEFVVHDNRLLHQILLGDAGDVIEDDAAYARASSLRRVPFHDCKRTLARCIAPQRYTTSKVAAGVVQLLSKWLGAHRLPDDAPCIAAVIRDAAPPLPPSAAATSPVLTVSVSLACPYLIVADDKREEPESVADPELLAPAPREAAYLTADVPVIGGQVMNTGFAKASSLSVLSSPSVAPMPAAGAPAVATTVSLPSDPSAFMSWLMAGAHDRQAASDLLSVLSTTGQVEAIHVLELHRLQARPFAVNSDALINIASQLLRSYAVVATLSGSATSAMQPHCPGRTRCKPKPPPPAAIEALELAASPGDFSGPTDRHTDTTTPAQPIACAALTMRKRVRDFGVVVHSSSVAHALTYADDSDDDGGPAKGKRRGKAKGKAAAASTKTPKATKAGSKRSNAPKPAAAGQAKKGKTTTKKRRAKDDDDDDELGELLSEAPQAPATSARPRRAAAAAAAGKFKFEDPDPDESDDDAPAQPRKRSRTAAKPDDDDDEDDYGSAHDSSDDDGDV